jgi:hypothetical protein
MAKQKIVVAKALPIATLPVDIVHLIVGFLTPPPRMIKKAHATSKNIPICKKCKYDNLTRFKCRNDECYNIRKQLLYLEESNFDFKFRQNENPISVISQLLQWYENLCTLLLAGDIKMGDMWRYMDVRKAVICYHYCRFYTYNLSVTFRAIKTYAVSPAYMSPHMAEIFIKKIMMTKGKKIPKKLKSLYNNKGFDEVKECLWQKRKLITNILLRRYARMFDKFVAYDGKASRGDTLLARICISQYTKSKDKSMKKNAKINQISCIIQQLYMPKNKEALISCVAKIGIEYTLRRTRSVKLKMTPNGMFMKSTPTILCTRVGCFCTQLGLHKECSIPVPYQVIGYPFSYSSKICIIKARNNNLCHRLSYVITANGIHLLHAQYNNSEEQVKKLAAYQIVVSGSGPNMKSILDISELFWAYMKPTYFPNKRDIHALSCQISKSYIIDNYDFIKVLSYAKKHIIFTMCKGKSVIDFTMKINKVI